MSIAGEGHQVRGIDCLNARLSASSSGSKTASMLSPSKCRHGSPRARIRDEVRGEPDHPGARVLAALLVETHVEPSSDWSSAVRDKTYGSRAEDMHSAPGTQGLQGPETGLRVHRPPQVGQQRTGTVPDWVRLRPSRRRSSSRVSRRGRSSATVRAGRSGARTPGAEAANQVVADLERAEPARLLVPPAARAGVCARAEDRRRTGTARAPARRDRDRRPAGERADGHRPAAATSASSTAPARNAGLQRWRSTPTPATSAITPATSAIWPACSRATRRLMNARGNRRAKIWVTELGWETEGRATASWSGAAARRDASRSFAYLRRHRHRGRLRLRGVVYYSWRDSRPYPPHYKGHVGPAHRRPAVGRKPEARLPRLPKSRTRAPLALGLPLTHSRSAGEWAGEATRNRSGADSGRIGPAAQLMPRPDIPGMARASPPSSREPRIATDLTTRPPARRFRPRRSRKSQESRHRRPPGSSRPSTQALRRMRARPRVSQKRG